MLTVGPNKLVPPRKTPIQQARELLGKVNTFVALAASETRVIRDIAKNLTAEGRQINLWEIMSEVNNTIRENPESGLARLMNRFYREYLVSAANDNNDVTNGNEAIYQKSLPSLLFLSFGIFLLNSVNQVITRRGLLKAGGGAEVAAGRMFLDDQNHEMALIDSMMKKHVELKDLFNIFDDFGNYTLEDTEKDATPGSDTIDTFLKLLMNLMKAYETGDDEEIECIWSIYCHQLNRQAGLGGMVSTVARINAVGLQAVLKKHMDKSEAIRRVVNNMWSWENMKCDDMFPKCKLQKNSESSEGVENGKKVKTDEEKTTE
jgi:hypothetical protein